MPELARLWAALREDLTITDVAIAAIAAGYLAGWALRVHDRAVWNAGHAAGAAAQRVRDELAARAAT